MPELFGSTYVLPVVIIVVLLLVLVLALLLNKRSRERKEVGGVDARRTTPPKGGDGPSRAQAEKRPAPAAVMTRPAKESHAPLRPELRKNWGDIGPASDATVSADPLKPVLSSLLHGWGELTREDLNRLSIFRPDRVQTAVRALELPKDLKNDQDARSRLDQLTRYAEELDVAAHDSAPSDQPLVESAAESSAEMPENTEVPGTVDTREDTPMTDTIDTAPEIDVNTAVVDADESLGAVTTAADSSETLSPDDRSENADPTVAPTPWLEEDHQWEEAPVRPPQEIEQEIDPRSEWSAETLAQETWEESTAGSAASATEEEPVDLLDDTLEVPPRYPPLLADTVTTSQDLLALPPEEQTEMVAFLQPAQLADVLKHTDDTRLKRAVIDTLEHVSTPASLEVLRRCLDDSDPEIQLYALQAADRILGND